MSYKLSRRGLIRLVSFALALILTLSVFCYTGFRRAAAAELKLEYQYLQSIDDLTGYLQNIDNTLLKFQYAGTESTLIPLASKLWRETGFAKECLSNLPVGALQLENTYKFLSQTGDYAVSLSEQLSGGEEIQEQDRENLKALRDYAHRFLEEVLAVQDGVRNGSLSFEEVRADTAQTGDESQEPALTDGFQEFEEGFTTYPTLIYDGPFSDNLLEKQPEMTGGAGTVSQEEAAAAAARAAGLEPDALAADSDEEGKMPSYCFSAGTLSIAVTKQGGYLSYLIDSRELGEARRSEEECLQAAQQYLDSMGYTPLKQTYYEINQGLMTINYAAVQDSVVCYPDLIKVGVAMDTGEVIRFDARGYLTNHKTREGLAPVISEATLSESISPLLSIQRTSLCVIPGKGTSEEFCYEVECTDADGVHVLVYLDAKTGEEEQILILYLDENGALTL